MLKTLLIVVAVSNGRFYHENIKYAVNFPTQAACEAEASKYATKGINYDRAECVPLVLDLTKEKK